MTTVLLHYGALLIDLGRAPNASDASDKANAADTANATNAADAANERRAADAANAAAMIEEGLAFRRAEYGETSWRTAEAHTIAADLRLAQGHRDQALAIWAQAVPILKKERPALRATRRAIDRWTDAASHASHASDASPRPRAPIGQPAQRERTVAAAAIAAAAASP
jgi:hypothetical protein